MRSHGAVWAVVAAAVLSGCATTGRLAAPMDESAPPVVVGAGLPMEDASPGLPAASILATVVSAPLHAVGCAGSAVVGGLLYGIFFPGDFAEGFKAWVAQSCAGPYVVTPAGLAAVPQPFETRAMRTPRTGRIPVEEAVRQAPAPR